MRQEKDREDLIGAALRRVYRIPGATGERSTDERFDDLIRRLARKEQAAPEERAPVKAACARP